MSILLVDLLELLPAGSSRGKQAFFFFFFF